MSSSAAGMDPAAEAAGPRRVPSGKAATLHRLALNWAQAKGRRPAGRRSGQRQTMGVEMSDAKEPVLVGGYRLGRRLDVAGSAETYQATGPGGEVVVLKVMRDVSPDLAADMAARLQAAARHPGLLTPSAWGRDGDDYYVVRDYIPGIDLESMIQAGGPLEPAQAARYVVEAAAAVAAIQSQGVSHGNLKTSNLLLSAESDIVMVTGWGMAMANVLPEEDSRAAATAYYLSPEEIESDRVLPQSDVYALGVILYELVTGEVPFDGISADVVIHKHLTATATPPSKRRAGVPAWIDEVVEKALQKDPASRYQSAEEMRKALVARL
jgi:eukaryotic-like serine/threonine-protein kinase